MQAGKGKFRRVLSVEDMRLLAKRRLPKAIFDFIDGAADDEVSRRRNRRAFDAWGFVQRSAVDVSGVDTSVTLFDTQYSAPFGIGPTGLVGLAWPNAETLLAQSAKEHGVPFCMSTVSSVSIEDLAAASGSGNWFQLYIFQDRNLSRSLMQRAKAAGYMTLVVTIDCPVGGNRERDPRNDFSLPLRPTLRNVFHTAQRPGWILRTIRGGIPRPENMLEAAAAATQDAESLVAFMNSQLDPSVTWRDVETVVQEWDGPVVVKGIVSPKDAEEAARIGAAGVVVSNHGGRQLDGSIAPVQALPGVRDAVGQDLTIICDSGFRRGTDIVKALALGADTVFMGRNTLYGVGAAGGPGVKHVLSILQEEVKRTMMLLGAQSVPDIARDHVQYLGHPA